MIGRTIFLIIIKNIPNTFFNKMILEGTHGLIRVPETFPGIYDYVLLLMASVWAL